MISHHINSILNLLYAHKLPFAPFVKFNILGTAESICSQPLLVQKLLSANFAEN